MANWNALATLNPDDAIRDLEQGIMLKQISARYGCDKSALYRKLKDHPDYAQAIVSQADSLVEQAMIELFECDSETVNIARARVDGAFKYAKARNPAVFGDKVQVTGQLDLRALLVNAYDPRALDGLTQRTIDVDQAGYVKSDDVSD